MVFFRYHTPINHGILVVVLSLVHCELKVHLSVLSFFKIYNLLFLFDLFSWKYHTLPIPKNGLDTTSVLPSIPSQNSFLTLGFG